MTTRMQATTQDGLALQVELVGNGEPLLLIAGLGLDRTAWGPIVSEYAAHHTVITYDHRGTGESGDRFPEHWSTRDFAQDALAVLDATDVRRAHVFGHSMGGRIAQWLAIDAPERVGALVLAGTSGGDARGVPRPASVTAAMGGGDAQALLGFCLSDAYTALHPEAIQLLKPRTGSAAMRAHLRASREHDAWDRLSSIRSPTLVIHGDEDGINVIENGRMVASAITDAELCVLHGARHFLHLDTPAANAATLEFLARHPLTQQA